MKIICMDCQNESYSDLESLKATRRFSCVQCAEKLRSNSDSGVGASAPSALDEHFEFYSGPLSVSDLPEQDEAVLEIPDEPFFHADSNPATDSHVILLPE